MSTEPTDIEAQLAAVLDERDKLARAREARSQPTAAELLAVAQRELAEDRELDRLEAEHGKVGRVLLMVRSEVGAVIVKRPHMATFRKFQEAKDIGTKELENLVQPCVLYPTRAEFDGMLKELPFLLNRCADAVSTLAGVRKEDIKGK